MRIGLLRQEFGRVWAAGGTAAAKARRIHVRFGRSRDVSDHRGCSEGVIVAPDYMGGEAVMVSADGQVVPEFLRQNWLRGTRALRQGALEHVLHRGLDIFASLTLLLLTLPLLLVVALAIKLDSRGRSLPPGTRGAAPSPLPYPEVSLHVGRCREARRGGLGHGGR